MTVDMILTLCEALVMAISIASATIAVATAAIAAIAVGGFVVLYRPVGLVGSIAGVAIAPSAPVVSVPIPPPVRPVRVWLRHGQRHDEEAQKEDEKNLTNFKQCSC